MLDCRFAVPRRDEDTAHFEMSELAGRIVLEAGIQHAHTVRKISGRLIFPCQPYSKPVLPWVQIESTLKGLLCPISLIKVISKCCLSGEQLRIFWEALQASLNSGFCVFHCLDEGPRRRLIVRHLKAI